MSNVHKVLRTHARRPWKPDAVVEVYATISSKCQVEYRYYFAEVRRFYTPPGLKLPYRLKVYLKA